LFGFLGLLVFAKLVHRRRKYAGYITGSCVPCPEGSSSIKILSFSLSISLPILGGER